MNLEQHAKNAQDIAIELGKAGKAETGILTMTIINGEVNFTAGGDKQAIIEGLANAVASDSEIKRFFNQALKLAPYAEAAGAKATNQKEATKPTDNCDCTACKLRRILEAAAFAPKFPKSN